VAAPQSQASCYTAFSARCSLRKLAVPTHLSPIGQLFFFHSPLSHGLTAIRLFPVRAGRRAFLLPLSRKTDFFLQGHYPPQNCRGPLSPCSLQLFSSSVPSDESNTKGPPVSNMEFCPGAQSNVGGVFLVCCGPCAP